MPVRVSPTERIRHQIDDLFAQDRELAEILEEVARLGVRLLMQTAIEAEVTEFFGRERYRGHGERIPAGKPQWALPDHHQDHDRAGDHRPAEAARHRRGVRLPALGSGVPYQRAGEPGHRRVRAGPVGPGRGGRPSRRLGRGGGDLEVDGAGSARPSRTASTAGRPGISDMSLEYLYLDGSHFRMHEGLRAEPVLAAWGITSEGRPVLIGLEPGASSRPTPGKGSWPTSWPAVCARRCWSSPTAPRSDSGGRLASPTACANVAPSTGPATSWPKCRPGTSPRSRPPTGSSSTPRTWRPPPGRAWIDRRPVGEMADRYASSYPAA